MCKMPFTTGLMVPALTPLRPVPDAAPQSFSAIGGLVPMTPRRLHHVSDTADRALLTDHPRGAAIVPLVTRRPSYSTGGLRLAAGIPHGPSKERQDAS